MERIDYVGAPLRHWVIVAVCAMIGALIALLIPVHAASGLPSSGWQANAVVGLVPSSKANHLGSNLSTRQLEFYATDPAVVDSAARSIGVKVTASLAQDVVVSAATSKNAGPKAVGRIKVGVVQRTKSGSAHFTNAFTSALSHFVDGQLNDRYQQELTNLQNRINNLQTAIDNLGSSGSSGSNGSSGSSSSTTSTTSSPGTGGTSGATTTSADPAQTPSAALQAPTASPTDPTAQAANATADPSTTAAGPSDTTTSTDPSATTTSTSSTTSTDPNATTTTTTATTTAAQPAVVTGAYRYGAAPSSSPSTTKPRSTTTTKPRSTTTTRPRSTTTTKPRSPTTSSPSSASIAVQRDVLSKELGTAIGLQQTLMAVGPPVSQVNVLSPARASEATAVPGPPLLAHRTARGPPGFVLGVLLGVLATYVIEAFDRRLRTAERTGELFGLPIVVEIPGEPPAISRTKEPAVPVIDVVVDPLSAKAEAYRKLHVAIRVAPLVTWVGPSSLSGQEIPYWREGLQSPELASIAHGPGTTPALAAAATGTGLLPAPGTHPGSLVPGADGTGHRNVILVTSPRDEPTRSVAVANLAAVFAEAGQRVLVATTGGLRTKLALDGRPGLPVSTLGPDPDPQAIIANARPSQLPGVSSLALGQVINNPAQLSLKAGALVRAARDVVDVVLLEAALLSTQDAEALMPVVDVVVVVSECWFTTAADAAGSKALLARHRAPVLGIAMTNVPDKPRYPWPPWRSRTNGYRGRRPGPVIMPGPPSSAPSPWPPPSSGSAGESPDEPTIRFRPGQDVSSDDEPTQHMYWRTSSVKVVPPADDGDDEP